MAKTASISTTSSSYHANFQTDLTVSTLRTTTPPCTASAKIPIPNNCELLNLLHQVTSTYIQTYNVSTYLYGYHINISVPPSTYTPPTFKASFRGSWAPISTSPNLQAAIFGLLLSSLRGYKKQLSWTRSDHASTKFGPLALVKKCLPWFWWWSLSKYFASFPVTFELTGGLITPPMAMTNCMHSLKKIKKYMLWWLFD